VPTQIAELIPKLPEPVRALPRSAIWTYGRLTAGLRPLPTALIIGAQKAGTTALYAWLRRHPAVAGPAWKEVNYFDRRYAKGERWYRGNFPVARGATVVLEATPGYLFHPLAPLRVRGLLPAARLVALVRDPIARAYSHYQHEVTLGREPLAFEDAIEAEEGRMEGELERMLADPAYFSYAWWNYTYLARGRYAEQLERWLAAFPEEQVLVVPTDDLAERPAETYAAVLAHVGAPAHELGEYPRVFGRSYGDMRPETRARLGKYFAEPNRRLYELLGRDLGWT
jgi:sulfotransferase family protein